jgi:hypothetical protein
MSLQRQVAEPQHDPAVAFTYELDVPDFTGRLERATAPGPADPLSWSLECFDLSVASTG